jgi:plasmid stabilization system protein ParE
MDAKVVLSEVALDDLQQISEYIARDNPEQAFRFGTELIDSTLPQASFPEMGRVIARYKNPLLRELVHGAYRIPYRILKNENEVHVLRFWHSARGTPEITL